MLQQYSPEIGVFPFLKQIPLLSKGCRKFLSIKERLVLHFLKGSGEIKSQKKGGGRIIEGGTYFDTKRPR